MSLKTCFVCLIGLLKIWHALTSFSIICLLLHQLNRSILVPHCCKNTNPILIYLINILRTYKYQLKTYTDCWAWSSPNFQNLGTRNNRP
ncbi:hypothetical protein Hanom_Chr01g00025071 [Helianthus anomalus]